MLPPDFEKRFPQTKEISFTDFINFLNQAKAENPDTQFVLTLGANPNLMRKKYPNICFVSKDEISDIIFNGKPINLTKYELLLTQGPFSDVYLSPTMSDKDPGFWQAMHNEHGIHITEVNVEGEIMSSTRL